MNQTLIFACGTIGVKNKTKMNEETIDLYGKFCLRYNWSQIALLSRQSVLIYFSNKIFCLKKCNIQKMWDRLYF